MAESQSVIKAIETVHSGYRFRSRLEARWAVFFETLGVPYQYELQGFDLGNQGRRPVLYLPDFYLPSLRWWVEIKPAEPTGKEAAKCAAFGGALFKRLCETPLDEPTDSYAVFIGTPGESAVWIYHSEEPTRGRELAECALCHRLIATTVNVGASHEGAGAWWDMYHCEWCDTRDRLSHGHEAERAYFSEGDIVVGFDVRRAPRLVAAFDAARSARFESGAIAERPRMVEFLPPGFMRASDVRDRQPGRVFRVADVVGHVKFGTGIVVAVKQLSGGSSDVTIEFEDGTVKTLAGDLVGERIAVIG
jgi:hypothetical protein